MIRIERVRLPEDAARARRGGRIWRTANAHHRWRHARGEFVGKRAALGRKRGEMEACACAQLPALTGKLHLPNLLLQRIALVRCIIHDLTRGVHAVHIAHFEIAACELTIELRVRPERLLLVVAVEIQVIVPVAPTREHDRSVAHRHVVVFVKELIVADLEHGSHIAVISVGKGNRAMLMIASQGFNPKRLAVDPSQSAGARRPAEASPATSARPRSRPPPIGSPAPPSTGFCLAGISVADIPHATAAAAINNKNEVILYWNRQRSIMAATSQNR